MTVKKVDGVSLRKAIQNFGSLEKAIAVRRGEKAFLEKENAQLQNQNSDMKLNIARLSVELDEMQKQLGEKRKEVRMLFDTIEKYGSQYQLFQGFLAMIASSPSVSDSIGALIGSLGKLLEPSWYASKNNEELRSLFVHTVLGDYLKSFKCDLCGSSFILSVVIHKEYKQSHYECPTCHYSHKVRADDSFLRAMISEKQLENTLQIEQLLKEIATLWPLRLFLNFPCDICGKPVDEWTEDSVKIGIMGYGWGHTRCWESTAGEFTQVSRLAKSFQETRKQTTSSSK